jgi:hypothetical protein
MFGSKCEKCGQRLVRLIELKSYSNFLMCPNMFQSLQANFKTEGNQIFCCAKNEERETAEKPKPQHCIFCNEQLVELGTASRNPFQYFKVCPSAFGLFLYAYETKRKGMETRIFCRTKIEVDAKLVKYPTLNLKRGIPKQPLVLAKLSTIDSLSEVRVKIDVPIGWGVEVKPEVIELLPAGSECNFEIYLSIPQATEPGEYFIRYFPTAEKLNGVKLGPTRVLKGKGFDKPSIVKIIVTSG